MALNRVTCYTMGMTERLLEFRCPNEPYHDKSTQCRREMFGVSLATLSTYSFRKPFVDFRHCPTCGIVWQITITSMKSVPVLKALEDGIKLDTMSPETVFGAIQVTGNIPKKRAA